MRAFSAEFTIPAISFLNGSMVRLVPEPSIRPLIPAPAPPDSVRFTLAIPAPPWYNHTS